MFQLLSALVLLFFLFILISSLRTYWKKIKDYQKDPVANPLKREEIVLAGFVLISMTFFVLVIGSSMINRWLQDNDLHPISNNRGFSFGAYDVYPIVLLLLSSLFLYMVSTFLKRIWKRIKCRQIEPWSIIEIFSVALGLAFMSFFGFLLGSKIIYQFF